MGHEYFQPSQMRKEKRKTKEFTNNYVDRIRLGEDTLQSFKGPFRGSGWRPKSCSHLDLATSYRDAPSYLGHLQNLQLRSYRSLDCNHIKSNNESLNEFYWRLDSNDNYETLSPKQHTDHIYGDESNYTHSSFPILHHQQYQPLSFDIGKDLCSLRRSRSLAAIHEETFSDLQTSSKSRRSQLIPRAKLIDPVFIRRFNCTKENSNNYQPQEQEYQHESFCSSRKSPILVKQKDNYDKVSLAFQKNQDLVNFQDEKHLLSYYYNEKRNWYNDRSDLESLNSDYFKNSLHQRREFQLQKTRLVAEPLCGGIEKQRIYKSQRDKRTNRLLSKFTKERKLTTKSLSTAVGSTESCLENSQSSVIPETTTSNSDDQTDSLSLSEQEYDVTETELYYQNSDSPKDDNGGIWELANFCTNDKKCVNDCLGQVNKSLNRLIAYDSVFLSSEEGSEETVIVGYSDESQNKVSSEFTSLLHISIHDKNLKPTAYQQLKYQKNIEASEGDKVGSLLTPLRPPPEPQPHTASLIGWRQQGTSSSTNISAYPFRIKTPSVSSKGSLIDNQYHSLPDINIGRSLKASERIDARLRSHYDFDYYSDQPKRNEVKQSTCGKDESDTYNFQEAALSTNYDSIQLFDRAGQHVREWENSSDHITQVCQTDLPKTVVDFDKEVESKYRLKTEKDKSSEEKCNGQLNSENFSTVCVNEIIVDNVQFKLLHSPNTLQTTKTANKYLGKSTPFKIVVTDTQENIIEEVSIDSLKPDKISEELFQPIKDKETGETLQLLKQQENTVGDDVLQTKNKLSKMPRPQIVSIIDTKPENSKSKIKSNYSLEKEYFQKVDAVRCYWSKLLQEDGNNASNEFVFENNQPVRNGVLTKDERNCESPNSEMQSFTPSIEIVELDGQKPATIVSAPVLSDANKQEFDHIRYKIMKSKLFCNNMIAHTKKEAQLDGLIQYLQKYSFQDLLSNNNVVIVEPVRTKIERTSKHALFGTTKSIHTSMEESKCKKEEKDTFSTSATPVKSIERHFFYQPVRVNRELHEEELPNPDTVRNVRKLFEQNILLLSGNKTCLMHPANEIFAKANKTISEDADDTNLKNNSDKSTQLTIEKSNAETASNIQKSVQKSTHVSSLNELSDQQLSSHCKCTEIDASITDKLLPKCSKESQQKSGQTVAEEFKNVHVKEFVRRHNNGFHESNTYCGKQPTERSSRTSCASEENCCFHNSKYFEDERNDYDENPLYNEEELRETYYVSKEILSRIRECGSSVTYYGGRILSTTLPDSRMKKAEPKKIEKYRTHHQRVIVHPQEICGNSASSLSNSDIKFKLIKSNSCSSRLELIESHKTEQKESLIPKNIRIARKEVYNLQKSKSTDSTTVPRIIESQCIHKSNRPISINIKNVDKILERQTNVGRNEILTINNQVVNKTQNSFTQNKSNDKLHETGNELVMALKQVTVNNHINVPSSLVSGPVEVKSETTQLQHDCGSAPQKKAKPSTTGLKTSAKNVDLNSSRDKLHNVASVGTTKICRNKNVDLAFTLTKSSTVNSDLTENDITLGNYCQGEKLRKNILNISRQSEVDNNTNGFHEGSVEQSNFGWQLTVPDKDIENNEKKSSIPLTGRNHNATLFENSFVRHYLTNDRRLLEKPKYDDVEFEEFEIYDPCKERKMNLS